jgi:diamine N-acetyltransferase
VLHLEEITAGNLDDAIGVTVRPDQDHLVAPVVKSLAEAYVHPTIAWPRLIRDGGLPVGFLMGFFDADFAEGKGDPDLRSGLWRLNVAVGAQGRGVGRFAVAAATGSRPRGIRARTVRRGSTGRSASGRPESSAADRWSASCG